MSLITTLKATLMSTGAAAILAVGLVGTADAANPAGGLSADPDMLAETCAACHGVDGASVGQSLPSLGGMNPDYFVQTMKDFANGTRHATVMDRVAKGYTEADLKAMGAYFAARPFVPAQQSFDAALAAKGRDLQAKYCENCHEKGGTVNADGVTIVAGQWRPYLEFSMGHFQQGQRQMERRKRQRFEALMAEQGAEGVEAIIHYLASGQ